MQEAESPAQQSIMKPLVDWVVSELSPYFSNWLLSRFSKQMPYI